MQTTERYTLSGEAARALEEIAEVEGRDPQDVLVEIVYDARVERTTEPLAEDKR